MKVFKITNHNLVGEFHIIQGCKVIKTSNEFSVIAKDRKEAIKIADSILGHTNYSLPWDYEAMLLNKKESSKLNKY